MAHLGWIWRALLFGMALLATPASAEVIRLADGELILQQEGDAAIALPVGSILNGGQSRLRISEKQEIAAGDRRYAVYSVQVAAGTSPWAAPCSTAAASPGKDTSAVAFVDMAANPWIGAFYRPEIVMAPLAGIAIFCEGGVVLKCIKNGYFPTDERGRTLLQTCVRAYTADYCGDGRPHTRNGTLIDIFDADGIQNPTHDPRLVFEAVWSPRGAECVRHTRWPDLIDLAGLEQQCPRLRGRTGDACTVDLMSPAAPVAIASELRDRVPGTEPPPVGTAP